MPTIWATSLLSAKALIDLPSFVFLRINHRSKNKAAAKIIMETCIKVIVKTPKSNVWLYLAGIVLVLEPKNASIKADVNISRTMEPIIFTVGVAFLFLNGLYKSQFESMAADTQPITVSAADKT